MKGFLSSQNIYFDLEIISVASHSLFADSGFIQASIIQGLFKDF